LSGLQAFKYVGEISPRRTHALSVVVWEQPAVTKPLPAGWVRQRRGAPAGGPCPGACCKLLLSGGQSGGPLYPRSQGREQLGEAANGNAGGPPEGFREEMRKPPQSSWSE
jgi:hypothetical protein